VKKENRVASMKKVDHLVKIYRKATKIVTKTIIYEVLL